MGLYANKKRACEKALYAAWLKTPGQEVLSRSASKTVAVLVQIPGPFMPP